MSVKQRGLLTLLVFFGLLGLTSTISMAGHTLQETPTTDPESALTTATVDVAHFAPFAADVAGTSVTIQVNGNDVFTETVFGDIFTDIELPSGTYTIEVLPGGVGPAAISGSVTLTPGGDYLLAAIGNKPGENLDLLVLVNDTEPVSGSAKVRIGHLAPFADNNDDTAVDVCTDGGAPVLEGVKFPDVTDPYLLLPPGAYDLKVVPEASNCGTPALDLPPLNLMSAHIVDVFVIGLGTTAFPLQAVSTTGLPIIYRLFLPFTGNPPTQNIVEIAASNPDFSTLVTAVTEAKLVETLSGPGPFTVFAPTNAAFDALPDGTLDALLQDPEGDLQDILLYHVLVEALRSPDISNGMKKTTALGKDVTFSVNGGVKINNANIIVTDILATNGVIHVIDTVILPPASR